jgi:hypothetical protein
LATRNEKNPREPKSLRDIVMDEAARRGIAREKVWEGICLAIAGNELPIVLPDNASLDTRLHGSTTWRDLITGAAFAAARGSDPARYQWTRALFLDPRAAQKWLDRFQRQRSHPKYGAHHPRQTHRASRREAALVALKAIYGTRDDPLASIKTITAEVNQYLALRDGRPVSEDTVSRALKRFRRSKRRN